MKWPPTVIAGFALEAGWTGEPLGLAVALAIAASGGDDGYRWVGQPGSRPDRRGLWAIDVTTHPEPGNADLFDPNVNARWAFSLWRSAGGSWVWHASWAPRGWLAYLPIAAAAIQNPAGSWRPGGWLPPVDLSGLTRAVAAQATVAQGYRPLAGGGGSGGGSSDIGVPLIGGYGNGIGMAGSRPTADDGPGAGRPIPGRDGSDVQDAVGDDGAGPSPVVGVLGGGGQATGGGFRLPYPRRRRAMTWGTA